jgi:alkylation response protein AidB-like acyl-CoA dehydrogenase
MRLTDEQHMLRDVARDFARRRLAPFAAERDREERFPAEAVAELGKLGFMGMLVPETYGGAGADHVGYALAMEEIAAGEGAVSTILSVQNSVGCMPVLQYGSEEQKQRFLKPMARGEMLSCFCLTEPQAGSDAAAIRTRARRHGNRWVLSGTKQFITSARIPRSRSSLLSPIRNAARRASAPFSCRPIAPVFASPGSSTSSASGPLIRRSSSLRRSS